MQNTARWLGLLILLFVDVLGIVWAFTHQGAIWGLIALLVPPYGLLVPAFVGLTNGAPLGAALLAIGVAMFWYSNRKLSS